MAARVRPEEPHDFPRVFEVHERAFGRRAEAELVDALRRAARPQVSLVAVEDDAVRGHIFFSPVSIAGASPAVGLMGLAPVAVEPESQGRGIGSALIRAGLDACRDIGQAAVFVLGHPGFYPRFGFVPAADRGFRWEHDVDPAAFLVAELEPSTMAGLGGVVRYLPEFSRV